MPIKGRSVDDLPLAAYSTGVDPETEPPIARDAAMPPATLAGAAVSANVGTPPVLALGALDEAAALPVPDDEPSASRAAIGLERARTFAKRNPRIAAGGLFVAVILIGLVLLSDGGPSPSAEGALASPSVPPLIVVAAPTGLATLVLTGPMQGTWTLAGGASDAAKAHAFTVSWTDAASNTVSLDATVDRGTRTTDATLVLRLRLVAADGTVRSFTSKAGECTIGMGVLSGAVSGSFTCTKLKSDDGKLTVGASGTYRT